MWDMRKGLAGRAPEISANRQNALLLLAVAERHDLPANWGRYILPPIELATGPFLLVLMKKQKVDHPGKLASTMQRGMIETEFVDGFDPGNVCSWHMADMHTALPLILIKE
jgi:hypothetical protein